MSDPLDFELALQTAIVTKLSGHAFFSDAAGTPPRPITVLAEAAEGDIEQKIAATVAKLGVCCIILTPTADNAHPNDVGPNYDLTVVVAVIENVLVNRGQGDTATGQPATLIASAVEKILHQFPVPDSPMMLTFERRQIGDYAKRNARLCGFTANHRAPDGEPTRIEFP